MRKTEDKEKILCT